MTDPTSMSDRYPKYYKSVSGIDSIDVYGVHKLFGVDDPSGAIQHASKKLLLSGVRTGGKSKQDDIREARDTLTRWLELEDSSDDTEGLIDCDTLEPVPPHTINAADQGWIENPGYQPVGPGVLVDTRWKHDSDRFGEKASLWSWKGVALTHYRLSK